MDNLVKVKITLLIMGVITALYIDECTKNVNLYLGDVNKIQESK